MKNEEVLLLNLKYRELFIRQYYHFQSFQSILQMRSGYIFKIETETLTLYMVSIYDIYIIQFIMKKQRLMWKKEEDEALRYLIQEKKMEKWHILAKILTDQYRFTSRTGKQCRERWLNCLNPKNLKTQWNSEQQQLLFKKQKQLGCRWAKIAKFFKGRSQNNIKNHYYTTLRKGLRRMNKYIELKGNNYRLFSNDHLSHILNICEQGSQVFVQQIVEQCQQIKDFLIKYHIFDVENLNKKQQQELDCVIELILKNTRDVKINESQYEELQLQSSMGQIKKGKNVEKKVINDLTKQSNKNKQQQYKCVGINNGETQNFLQSSLIFNLSIYELKDIHIEFNPLEQYQMVQSNVVEYDFTEQKSSYYCF